MKWTGYPSSENSWQSSDNLKGAPEILEEYNLFFFFFFSQNYCVGRATPSWYTLHVDRYLRGGSEL